MPRGCSETHPVGKDNTARHSEEGQFSPDEESSIKVSLGRSYRAAFFIFGAREKNIGVFVGVGEDWRRETSGLRNALSYKCRIRGNTLFARAFVILSLC
jgi:hypothetical protein